VIVVAGNKKFITDCLIAAKLARPANTFAINKVAIVPLVMRDPVEEAMGASSLGEKRGFGTAKQQAVDIEMLMINEPYVTRPEDKEKWLPYIEKEFSDAEKQGNPTARDRGIGIVMRKDGKIIRKGVGVPDWREAIEELVGEKTIRDNIDAYTPDFPTTIKKK